RPRGAGQIADTPPEIELEGHEAESCGPAVEIPALPGWETAYGASGDDLRARRVRVRGDGRHAVRALHAKQPAGFLDPGDGHRQIPVALERGHEQRLEPRVLD